MVLMLRPAEAAHIATPLTLLSRVEKSKYKPAQSQPPLIHQDER